MTTQTDCQARDAFNTVLPPKARPCRTRRGVSDRVHIWWRMQRPVVQSVLILSLLLLSVPFATSRFVPSAGAQTAPAQIYWGALVGGAQYGLPDAGPDMRAVDVFEAHAGKNVSILHIGQPWYRNGVSLPFPRQQLDNIRNHGSIPLFSWSSRDGAVSDTNQPAFRNSVIANGAYDPFLRQFATEVKNWGYPFFLRFDWEMNGWWYAWGEGKLGTTGNIVNGNTAGDYARMWRHILDPMNCTAGRRGSGRLQL